MALECMSGPLPWRHLETKTEILHMKRQLQIGNLGRDIAPQFADIWDMISALEYADAPPYEQIREKIREAMKENKVNWEDEWDWHPQILFMGGDEPFDAVREMDSERELTYSDRNVTETLLNVEPLLGGEQKENWWKCPCCSLA
jgi:hypothetical protein